MKKFSEELKLKLFALMRIYSGAQYALEEVSSDSSYADSSSGHFVKEVAKAVSQASENLLNKMGYMIRPFIIENHKLRFVSNQPLEQGSVFFSLTGGGIAFEHQIQELCMQVTEQARFMADRFLPDSWDYLREEFIILSRDEELANLSSE